MSDLTKPRTNDELFLAAISGDYSGELPAPTTRVQEYLAKICKNGMGGGGGTVDLSNYATKEDVTTIIREAMVSDSARHVHTNIQSLMEITAADITSLHRTFPQKIYEIEQSLSDYATKEDVAQLDSNVSQLNKKTIKFRHGKGNFNATAVGTNIVWKYGSQEIQGESCTFDVKSDNGLIVIEFDEITKIIINDDKLNKLSLSDLGGNITNHLSLTGCSQITGDLSDLGGNITSTIGLTDCSQITGDLSDLGGNITSTISLNNCSKITGDLSDLGGNITYYIGLGNCSQITGDLSDLGGNITSTIGLNNCSKITGVYSGKKYPVIFVVSNTAITANDMDQNLINFSNSTTKNGKFTATNMTRTAASDDAITTLVANGWTVSGLTKVEV